MSSVILFIPKAEKTAQQNLSEFVRVAKEDLTIFGSELDFDSNTWDVTGYINQKGRGNKKLRCCFHRANNRDKNNAEPM